MGFKQWKWLEIAFYVDLASFPCQIVGKSIEIAIKRSKQIWVGTVIGTDLGRYRDSARALSPRNPG